MDGFDLDPDVIAAAAENASEAGLADRVRFSVLDAADPDLPGRYDLVTIFEALHDMARPVEALAAARGMLAEGGSVVVADEAVADELTVPASEMERYAYGWSVVSCLPGAMGDPGRPPPGPSCARPPWPATPQAAGFARTEALPLQSDVWRFYRLVP